MRKGFLKKIAIISGLFGIKNVGGAELQLYYLSCEFSKMGYDVHVITSRESVVDTKDPRIKGVKLHFLKCKPFHTSIYKLDFYFKALRELIRVKPDLCLVRTAPLAPLSYLYAMIHRKRFVYSVTSDKDCYVRKLKNFQNIRDLFKTLVRMVSRIAIKNADAVIAQSEHQKEQLKENLDIESVVIRNGHFVPETNLQKLDPPIVLWLANLRIEKRIDLFVKLAQHFKNTNCRFVVAGKAMDAGCIEILEHGIKEQANLCYYGALSAKEALNLVDKASILVNTSDIEGFPNSFIEAWMRKTPTVTLNVDPDNIIKCFRIGFHSKSFENMVRETKILLENRALRLKMGWNAYNYAKMNHNMAKVAKKFSSVFESL